MSRFINPVTQYVLNNGDLASDGELHFFENNNYSVRKNTFNISGAVNSNPVILDGSGRIPDIFGAGLYSVEYKSSDGVLQWSRDSVEFSGSGSSSALVSPTVSGNMTFLTSGSRITGDFSNALESSRVLFQTSAASSPTRVAAIPSGAATTSNFAAYNNSNPDNASAARITATATDVRFESTISGSGSYLLFSIYNGGISRISVDSSGHMFPSTDNAYSCGKTSFRFSSIWSANGTIQTSDERTKKDITPSSLGLDFVCALEPVSYKFIVGKNEVSAGAAEGLPQLVTPIAGERTHWGLIAQQVKEAADAAGVDFGGWILTEKNDADSQQGLRYDQFIAPLIKAVQELSSKNLDLESRLSDIEAMLAI